MWVGPQEGYRGQGGHPKRVIGSGGHHKKVMGCGGALQRGYGVGGGTPEELWGCRRDPRTDVGLGGVGGGIPKGCQGCGGLPQKDFRGDPSVIIGFRVVGGGTTS